MLSIFNATRSRFSELMQSWISVRLSRSFSVSKGCFWYIFNLVLRLSISDFNGSRYISIAVVTIWRISDFKAGSILVRFPVVYTKMSNIWRRCRIIFKLVWSAKLVWYQSAYFIQRILAWLCFCKNWKFNCKVILILHWAHHDHYTLDLLEALSSFH